MAPSKSMKTRLPFHAPGGAEVAAVGGDELICSVVEAVPGQFDVGMRERHVLPTAVVKGGRGGRLAVFAAEQPVPVQIIKAGRFWG